MPTVKKIEDTIAAIEGFQVTIVSDSGVDLRSDRVLAADYPRYERRLPDSRTVEDWKEIRFRPYFGTCEVHALLADRTSARGQTKLRTVRATYAT
jgi:hypothetical protein